MNRANLQLSAEEMRLVADPAWILTKNSVMVKAVGMMGELASSYREIWGTCGLLGTDDDRSTAFGGIDPGNPKVSRGENYRGLPWVILDYPRIFGREDVLAIRTFFWWGHSFSVTLHLKGRYQALYLPVIQGHLSGLAAAGFQVGISDDEWRHEHTPEVFREMAADEVLGDGDFFKLSAAVGLDRWAEMPEVLASIFERLVRALVP